MNEWMDSEAEDSPNAGDRISNMFSTSPNQVGAASMRRKAHSSVSSTKKQPTQQSTQTRMHRHASNPVEKSTVRVPPPPPIAVAAPQPTYVDVPVRMVPEMRLVHGGQESKRILIRRIQQDSMKMLTMTCQAVMVRGASGTYNVYHLEISSDFYKQKWVVCKRFSEFYRLRKRLLARILAHKKHGTGCTNCGTVHTQLKTFGFPPRVELFQDQANLVVKRTQGLEAFIVALCQYIAGDSEFQVCPEINASRFMVKEFLQFPLDHECQHVRAVRQLKYVDPRDVQVDTDSCPICLSEWRELDGNQLTLSPCGHFFHENCINEWYRTRFDCPMCRTIAGQE